jgi:hypothetical protein
MASEPKAPPDIPPGQSDSPNAAQMEHYLRNMNHWNTFLTTLEYYQRTGPSVQPVEAKGGKGQE